MVLSKHPTAINSISSINLKFKAEIGYFYSII